jgi:IMP dehydrogenase
MKFLGNRKPDYELTYNDAFLVPQFTELASRMDVDISTPDKLGSTIPIVVANMTSVAGKRMAETVTRRGGLVVLPQDIPQEEMIKTISYLKSAHTVFETPITLNLNDTIQTALNLIHKRSHGAVIITNGNQEPVGIFTESDVGELDRYTKLEQVMSSDLVTLSYDEELEQMFEKLIDEHISIAPVIKNGKLQGVMSKRGAIRSMMYKPAVDKKGRLLVAAALGINGTPAKRAQELLDIGVDILVVDTAHGHQKKMLEAIKQVRTVAKNTPIVAGNVVTAIATEDLIKAGADIIKVGVGPGAACTTRMVTGVGRPQLSAVMECAATARKLGKHVWADGGTKYPRDFALALAAGASNVMVGSWFSRTYESPGDLHVDSDGRMYKENYGMASRRAVSHRNRTQDELAKAYKRYFREGISDAKMYMDSKTASVENIIDQITAGVRSSLSYMGATNIDEFYAKAVFGVQSSSGFAEGEPRKTGW